MLWEIIELKCSWKS